MLLDDDQQLRYSRHLLLDEWSEAAQQRLLNAHALVIGAGGLGAPALMYLASCGVGRITVVDPDTVDLTNLQRQIAHTTARIGQPKVLSAELAMAELNPGVQVHAIAEAADEALLDTWVPQAQVVLDCTDRFAIRQTINRACRTHGVLPVDGPFGDFSDDEGFRAQARRSATLGMVGKWAIHPKQVTLANEIFTPSDAAVAEAYGWPADHDCQIGIAGHASHRRQQFREGRDIKVGCHCQSNDVE